MSRQCMQKAFAYLVQFCFLLHYKPGKEMEDVDAVSRIDPEQAVSTEPSPVTDAATEATKEHVAAGAMFSTNAHMRADTCLVELEYTAETPVVVAVASKKKGKTNHGKGRGKLAMQADKFGAS